MFRVRRHSVFGLLALLACTSAHAIEKTLHPRITQQAIDQLAACFPNDVDSHAALDFVAPKAALIVSLYSGLEDESPRLDRARNWHFYDAFRDTDQRMRSRYGPLNVHASLHRIFARRLNDLQAAVDAQDIEAVYRLSGRVIHYIQDMAVPAHVAPIYHAKPGDSWIERWLIEDEPDPFDRLIGDAPVLPRMFVNSCQSLRMDNQHLRARSSTQNSVGALNQLLVDLAEETRSAIQAEIPVATGHPLYGMTWETAFWRLRRGDPDANYPEGTRAGFSHYGVFGREGFKLDSPQCGPHTGNNVCAEFVAARHMAVVLASLRALLLINDAYAAAVEQ